jgi:hypothetical protein
VGWVQRVEQRLERTINGAFAKAFRAEVQPVEIAGAVRRAMDEGAQTLAPGRTLVPSRYTVELSPSDYDRLAAYEAELRDELLAAAQEHAESQRYQAHGPFEMRLTKGGDLETGLFRIHPAEPDRAGGGAARHTASGRNAGVSAGATGARPAAQVSDPRLTPSSPPAYAPAPSVSPTHAPAAHASTPYAPTPQNPTPQNPTPQNPTPRGPSPQAPTPQSHAAHAPTPQVTDHPGPRPAPGATTARRPAAPGEVFDWAQDGPHAPAAPAHPAHPAPTHLAPTHPAPARRAQDPAPLTTQGRALDRPWLEIGGDRYPLVHALTVLGRETDAQILVADANVSRRHCEVRVTSDGPHLVANIRDLDSLNGTWVNGERITSARLGAGDRIRIGQTDVVFHAGRK